MSAGKHKLHTQSIEATGMMYLRKAIRKLRGAYTPGIEVDLFFSIVFGFLIPVPVIVLLIYSPHICPPANADEWTAILLPFVSILFTVVILTATGFSYSWEFDGEQIIRRGRFGKVRQRLFISEIMRVNFTDKDRYENVALIIETKDQRAVIPINKALKEELYYAGIHL
jgi:hypothetical protein